ncbi:MAG TPA: KH domain-containing protein [Candidatus Paceibacterota bacterium]|nr:KH domain-containing protein [Candidatus Paceibacterota bacterium]
MSEAHNDKEFLEFIVQSIVTNPDGVKVTRVVDEMGVLLTLDVDPADMSRVIGRMGNTAKAIRTLLRVVGMKHNARVNLKINEPAGGRPASAGSSTAEAANADAVDDVINDLKAE